jgi:hypothetical protein
MKELYGLGIPFGTPLRYRIAGESPWSIGDTVELNGPELMFLAEAPLELNADIELVLPAKVQVVGHESPLKLLCAGRVVRRFLANWPELRSAVVVSLSICQVEPEPDQAQAAVSESIWR